MAAFLTDVRHKGEARPGTADLVTQPRPPSFYTAYRNTDLTYYDTVNGLVSTGRNGRLTGPWQ
jgi:hypothetical protein